ncbi:MAG: hypothetical protein F6K58_01905 [Symploca sp. SIO2E9]|nr:hypothetical protein [Symploca sp. SIO2E9]
MAEEAAKYVLEKHCESGGGAYSPKKIKQFTGDLEDYLFYVYHCLYLGNPNLLYKEKIDPKIPLTLEPGLYVKAFEFIKEQRVPENMPSEVTKKLRAYLSLLITLIPL